jgi:hypothetical protein
MEEFQCHHHMKEVCQMQACGSGAATPPHPPPYMFLTKFSWRSIQQMQKEGTANIGYKIGRLHHWSNLEEDWCNHKTSKDSMHQTININHQKIQDIGEDKKIIMLSKPVRFYPSPFLYFQLLCKFIYV